MRKARVDTFSLKTAFLLRNKSNQRSDEAMAVFRVEKNKGYTVMSNHHLRNKELDLQGFPGVKMTRQGFYTFSLKNGVLLRNILSLYP